VEWRCKGCVTGDRDGKNECLMSMMVLYNDQNGDEELTCLRSDSMIASFCLICASRYSRLLLSEIEEQSEPESDDGIAHGKKEGSKDQGQTNPGG
jgi:hypothetical protein